MLKKTIKHQNSSKNASEVTDQLFKDIGMDIIKKKINNAGGLITFETETDLSTTFFIELPL